MSARGSLVFPSGSLGRVSRGFVIAGVLVIVLGLGLASVAHGANAHSIPRSSGGNPGGPGSVVNATINATDAPAYLPHSLTAPGGSILSLSLVNKGNYFHTFTLSRTANVTFDPRWTPAQLDRFFNVNGSLANISIAPQSSWFTNISIPQSLSGATLEFVSVVPYQFQAGMAGFLNVSAPTGPPVQLLLAGTTQLSWVPSGLEVSTTSYPVAVQIQLTNLGSVPHTFAIESTPNVNLSSDFAKYFQQHPPLVSVNLPQSTGSSVLANFTVPAKGVYEFICTVPGHFDAGMFGFLYVGVPAPPAPAALSTAIVQEGILVGGGALLAIGVVLAVVASLTGRFPPTSPPAHHH